MINVVLVLRSGRNFGVRDVALLAKHIHKTSDAVVYCLSDVPLDIPGVNYIPMHNPWQKWWSRMEIYSPRFLDLRPFLYVDLDTAVLKSLNEVVDDIKDKQQYIPLEDFYQKGKLATGFLWMPKLNIKINRVWIKWLKAQCPDTKSRMDYFLRQHIDEDVFWQQITNKVVDFKPKTGTLLQDPKDAHVVCFHGKPSIWEANIPWVKKYRNE